MQGCTLKCLADLAEQLEADADYVAARDLASVAGRMRAGAKTLRDYVDQHEMYIAPAPISLDAPSEPPAPADVPAVEGGDL